nr:hypothetical protein [Tanacetum cinerariifolium]
HRAVRRLRRTPGLDHLLDRGQLLRDPGNGQRRPPVRRRAVAPVGAQQGRQAGAVVQPGLGQAHGRPDRGEPPGPAAGDHAVLQPGAGCAAGRSHGRHRADGPRHEAAGLDHHQVRRRRGGVPGFAIEPADLDHRGGGRDLCAAGRAVRELHPP